LAGSQLSFCISREGAYNITSLPEQFEVFHDYHQHGSQRSIGRTKSLACRQEVEAIGEEWRGEERRGKRKRNRKRQ